MATQQRIQQLVPGFRFNLGFSGKYFHHGTSEENLGDDLLLGKYCLLYRYPISKLMRRLSFGVTIPSCQSVYCFICNAFLLLDALADPAQRGSFVTLSTVCRSGLICGIQYVLRCERGSWDSSAGIVTRLWIFYFESLLHSENLP